MPWVAGVDGCRGGWFVVLREMGLGRVVHRVINSIEEVLSFPEKPEAVAVDIPIGLLEHAVEGGRECDRQARALLGSPRASSVFTPPVRASLSTKTYEEACRVNAESSFRHICIARQCFALFPKLREIDEFMTPERQQTVCEVHPELCFYELAGKRPMQHAKKTSEGIAERRTALVHGGIFGATLLSQTLRFRGTGVDDVLDAYAACWTAERILRGDAVRIPPNPPHDSTGFRMEIWR